ncbi:hypothetical protein [Kosmotoga pacifica]|uniref:N-acetyltransferase domain-containing protein n=1 Tax=Kosmotoga pacifica TaxID=1330330 RepID=A0A0G2Z5H0_9BACT|nr:hypothetical protein [Kosmotoga pacifica]AKI96865.1 hypothetical protein IX53_02425 [Kosmotoga pacifica]
MKIVRVTNSKSRRAFIDLPFGIYKDYPQWVPPFRHEMKRIVRGKGSQLLKNGPHDFFVVLDGKNVVGRICVGKDEVLNSAKGVKHAYFTLFEAIDNEKVAHLLLKQAQKWALEKEAVYLKGPVSPTNGDDYRGLLIDNFEEPPSILMPYNPPYYRRFFKNFSVYLKYYAFSYDPQKTISEREIKLTKIAMKRFSYRVENADFSDMKKLARDLYKVMVYSMPDWEEDLMPPSFKEIYEMAKTMKLVADPELVIIARSGNRPIGFLVALPDFNDLIREIRGKLFPFGWIRLLAEKKSIDKVRAAILFVTEDFRNKGVPAAMFVKAFENIKNRGYKHIEGSSISWKNSVMLANASRIGGKQYKTYVVFGKSIVSRELSLEEIYGRAAWKFEKASGND